MFIRTSAILVSLSLLVACGGGGGGSSDETGLPSDSGQQAQNQPPVAYAGADKMVPDGTNVELAGSASDVDGTITSFLWTQIDGPAVQLTDDQAASASFMAPEVDQQDTLRFELTVTDNDGATATDTIDILVTDVAASDIPHGLSKLTFDHNGTEREYYLYIPASYDGSDAVPLLFDFHSGNGTSESAFNRSRFDLIADREGFILVTPQGLNRSWQTTEDNPQPLPNQDIDYVLSLLHQLTAEFNVDEERLYLAGSSAGAGFTFEIACQRSDVFAAVAAIMGAMNDSQLDICFPPSAMPVLQIHGTEDMIADYSQALATLDFWITVNQTNPVPIVLDIHDFDENDGSTVEYYFYGAGINMVTVEHFKVIGGGHHWPGFAGNNDINASEEAWAFFKRSTTTARSSSGVGLLAGPR